MEKAITWVCYGVPSTDYREAEDRIKNIRMETHAFTVKKKWGNRFQKCGGRKINSMLRLAFHLAKCLEAGNGAVYVAQDINLFTPSFTKCYTLIASACGMLEDYSKHSVVFVPV